MTTPSTQAQALMLAVPGNNLDAYMRAVNAVPVLSADDEQRLAEQYYYEQDLDAARNLVLAHLRFVVHIARSYTGYGLPLGDLVQEGNVGLMKAVKRFDPTKGVRLVSFAVHWIKAEIHEYVIKNWRIVKVATTKAQRKLFFNLRGQKKQLGRLSMEEAQRVADDLGVGMSTLNKWITAHRDTDVVSKEDLSLAEENDRLRRENRILKEEREVLKKATVFFASQKP